MNIMALDCEFNQPSHKLIQIGAAAYKVKTGELLGVFMTYVNPGEPISKEITELTGITDEDVKNAPTAKEAYFLLKEFQKQFKCFMNPIVWGSGTRNDSSMIYDEASPGEPNFMGFRIIDAKTIYQSYKAFINKGMKGGLFKACEHLKIGWDETYGVPHRALADAHNTFRVWHHMMEGFCASFKRTEETLS